MKKKSKTSQLASLIESDRLLLSKDTAELIRYDLKRLLENYFSSVSNVDIEVLSENYNYKIIITGEASSIKSFKIIK